MSIITPYRHSLALLTDLYELTMAYGYWKLNMADRHAAFYLLFRENPFDGGFAVAAGLEYLIDYLANFHFSDDDLAYLATIVDPLDITRRKTFAPDTAHEDLLVPIFRSGRLVDSPPRLDEIRRRTQCQLQSLHPGIKRFVNPHEYPVGLEQTLHDLRTQLILQTRGLALKSQDIPQPTK